MLVIEPMINCVVPAFALGNHVGNVVLILVGELHIKFAFDLLERFVILGNPIFGGVIVGEIDGGHGIGLLSSVPIPITLVVNPPIVKLFDTFTFYRA